MHRISWTLCLALMTPAAADAQPARPLANPESVVMQAGSGFVSNIGAALDPSARDGDGFIARIGADGNPVAGPLIPQPGTTLDAPKGLAVLEGRLYVADIDRIVAFDPVSGRQLAEFRPQDAKGLNDVAAAGDRLLVTDFDAGRLLSLDPSTGAVTTITQGIGGANGVVATPDSRTAYVVASGARFEGGGVTRVDLATGAVSPVGTARGILDGVALAADGSLIVSDWVSIDKPVPGRLLRIDSATGAAEVMDAPAMRGPADLFHDGDRLFVPALPENRIAILPAR